jgi:glucosamine kinase
MSAEGYVVGIDGGGTSARAVVTDANLVIYGESKVESVNPVVVGKEVAAERIHAAVREALEIAGIAPEAVRAAGIGVAGAAATHSEAWLREAVTGVLPAAVVVPSTDYEIALVGAHGKREGVLVLAGTGSLAYGVNAAGESLLAGGYGYLLGDEGGGYWVGLHGLKAVIAASEGRAAQTLLTDLLLGTLKLSTTRELIPWLYRSETPRVRDIAALAPLVVDCAGSDQAANDIVMAGAQHLETYASTVVKRLSIEEPAIAFAGSLLGSHNALSDALCARLGLETPPVPLYPPMIGAALLALEN